MNIILGAMREAWSPVLQLDISHVSTEVNPQFAQIADDNDPVLFNEFTLSLGSQAAGSIHVVIPYNSLKPVRDVLRSRVQGREQNDEKDSHWRAALQEACQDANLELVVKMGRIPSTLQQLRNLGCGDILYFNKPENAWAEVNGFQLFDAEVGSFGSNAAIKVKSVIKPENSPAGVHK